MRKPKVASARKLDAQRPPINTFAEVNHHRLRSFAERAAENMSVLADFIAAAQTEAEKLKQVQRGDSKTAMK